MHGAQSVRCSNAKEHGTKGEQLRHRVAGAATLSPQSCAMLVVAAIMPEGKIKPMSNTMSVRPVQSAIANGRVLPDQTQALQARIAELEAKLRASTKSNIKISPKGGVSVYGHGRFPTTLYASQWVKVLSKAEAILAFIEANADQLAKKNED